MSSQPPGTVEVLAEWAPLTFAQDRLLFLHLLDPTDAAYHVTVASQLEGRTNLAALRSAMRAIVARHEVLRSVFRRLPEGWAWSPGSRECEIAMVDLSRLPAPQLALDSVLEQQAARPYDLLAGPPLRWTLVRLGPTCHVLVLAVHHIVFDGASLAIVGCDLSMEYNAACTGDPAPTAGPARRYGEVARDERAAHEDRDRAVSYWQGRLRGAPPRLEVFPAGAFDGGVGEPVTARSHLSSRLLGDLQARQGFGCTTPMMLTAALVVLLARYSGQDDVVVGIPVSLRGDPDLSAVVGLLVNVLPLRVELAPDCRFDEVVRSVRDGMLDGLQQLGAPFEQIVTAMGAGRSPGSSPIFQTQIVHQQRPAPPILKGLRTRAVNVSAAAAKYELTVVFTVDDEGIFVDFEALPGVCDEDALAALAGHLTFLLEVLAAGYSGPVSAAPLCHPRELGAAVESGEGPDRPRSRSLSLHGLVWEQSRRSPDAVAVFSGESQFTYAALVGWGARYAAALCDRAAGDEQRVGVLMHRSPLMVAALLGILAAGAAYVPLDPTDPPERLAWMLADADVRVVLSTTELEHRLPADVVTILESSLPGKAPAPQLDVHPEQAAYVIYTSGSTGRPKGVVVPHRGIVNRLLWMQEQFELTCGERVLQKTPATFDVSVWELFWPLLTGGAAVLADAEGHRNPSHLLSLLRDRDVSVAYFVPSLLTPFLHEVDRAGTPLPALRSVMCSGEALAPRLRDELLDRLPVQLTNLYGPTEASIDVSAWPCLRETPVRVGTPITNVGVHVLDSSLQPVPDHVVGELYITGDGLARGYYGRPRLTAQAFVPDGTAGSAGTRSYRSGDRARRWPDATLEFMGRVDGQLKLGGNRIEPSEIEAVLCEHAAVAECVVIAPEGRLVAYVVPSGSTPERSELLAHARSRLPVALVPSVLVFLDALPLTSSGKTDRRALPAPGPERRGPVRVVEQPRNQVEALVAKAWCTVLGRASVGIHENFFDAGGSSLMLIDLHRVLQRTFVRGVTVGDLLAHPTVAALAASLTARTPTSAAPSGAERAERRRAALAKPRSRREARRDT